MKENSKKNLKTCAELDLVLIQSYGGNTRYGDTLADNTH